MKNTSQIPWVGLTGAVVLLGVVIGYVHTKEQRQHESLKSTECYPVPTLENSRDGELWETADFENVATQRFLRRQDKPNEVFEKVSAYSDLDGYGYTKGGLLTCRRGTTVEWSDSDRMVLGKGACVAYWMKKEKTGAVELMCEAGLGPGVQRLRIKITSDPKNEALTVCQPPLMDGGL